MHGWRAQLPPPAPPPAAMAMAVAGPAGAGGQESRRAPPADDYLTRCYPKDEAARLLGRMVERARRHRQLLSVVVLQVVAPAVPNGADGGLLNDISGFMLQRLRCIDVVARWEKTTFAVFLPGLPADLACQVAHRLQHYLEAGDRAVSCTIGVGDTSGAISATELAPMARQILFQAGRRRPPLA
ncbi:hypothetical protein DUGA2_37070 [Duganella sp. HH101]|nr:hypothetical protein DUGA2_37070 [Duganella sp. HH101]